MMHSIGIFDSNDDGSIEEIAKKYSETVDFHRDRRDINDKLTSLAKDPIISFRGADKKDYSYLLIHQIDIDSLSNRIDEWIQSNRTKIILYSGAATGEDGIYQRIEIRRKLEDFILRVQNNEVDPLQIFRVQPLRSIVVWSHVYQHEFGNLYAPLDYLALLYQGGDIDGGIYQGLKVKLQSKVSKTLANKKHTNKKWDKIFKIGKDSFCDIESVQFEPNHSISINKLVSYPVIHVDDEIDNGWDLLFPKLFGGHYIRANTPEQGIAQIEKYANSSCLVLLDLRMPKEVGNLPDKQTGYTALRTIRNRWPSLPVYVFSANADYESYGDALRQGATGYLVKYTRSLEARTDSALYLELWNTMRSSRIANIKHCISIAFSSILSHKNFASLPNEYRAEGALFELSQALRSISFGQMAMEDGPDINSARYLIISMYKTIEQYVSEEKIPDDEYPIGKVDYWIEIPRAFRNRSAHNYRIKVDKERVWPGIREVLLSASILITKWGELLKDESWSKNHLDWLEGLLLINNPDQRELREPSHNIGLVNSREKGVAIIDNFLNKTKASGRHAIVEILAVDCYEYKNLDDGSYFTWLKSDSLCPINYASVRLSSVTSVAGTESKTTLSRTIEKTAIQGGDKFNRIANGQGWKKHRKSLDDLFEYQNGEYFHRMNKYCNQVVDLSNSSQFDYLAWYFREHIQKYPNTYEESVFTQFNEWLSTKKPSLPTHPEDNHSPLSPNELSIYCLDITSMNENDPRDRIGILIQKYNSAWIPRINRCGIDSLYQAVHSKDTKFVLKGFRMGFPTSINGMKILPISPSILNLRRASRPIGKEWVYDGSKIWKFNPGSNSITNTLNVSYEGGHLTTMHDAKLAFDEVLSVAKKSDLLVSGPISWSKLGEPGRFPDATLVESTGKEFDLIHVKNVIRNALDGIKLTVLDAIGRPNEAVSLKQCITNSIGRPIWMDQIEDSDAFIAIIDNELKPNQIEELISELNGYNKPYLVINPGSYTNKTYGIAIGLRARLLTPLWTLSGRKPKRLFIGLDIGTRSGNESILATSCVDHTGRLRAWCRVNNPGRGTGPERINPNTFKEALSLIWDKICPELDHEQDEYELVIHRDGNTLEDEGEFISILESIGFTNNIEWIDVIKKGAPIVFGKESKNSGLHLHINNNKDREQYWNMQSVQDGKRYIRPLVIEKIEGASPLSVLAAEVFYLGQVATHHYLGLQKLPVSTYYADGFSKSGSEFLSFVGYEHLRA